MTLPASQDSLIAFGFIISRLCLAAVYLYSAFDKLFHWHSSIKEVESLKLPLPSCFAALTILVQFTGGFAIVFGIVLAPAALLLAGFTLVATLLGHHFWLLRGVKARREFTRSLEHLAIVGGLCLLALQSIKS